MLHNNLGHCCILVPFLPLNFTHVSYVIFMQTLWVVLLCGGLFMDGEFD